MLGSSSFPTRRQIATHTPQARSRQITKGSHCDQITRSCPSRRRDSSSSSTSKWMMSTRGKHPTLAASCELQWEHFPTKTLLEFRSPSLLWWAAPQELSRAMVINDKQRNFCWRDSHWLVWCVADAALSCPWRLAQSPNEEHQGCHMTILLGPQIQGTTRTWLRRFPQQVCTYSQWNKVRRL